ncbi:VanZ family protein [Pseudodesulfovibrio piezophilus]|uniref:Putative VanZ family protein n=1 Tax=Pseudodesulfovibrio piezophilus (strain DSM 21447 / JCM 15486 / C1TLV30) TaxID=1322246 RepID=M1WU17_PSEP2|nr:VanZ family protein [Pseudodesulfovibrio piezophilus]CCH50117.1 putative VanZ family protein [Pseudodesulfovibrio piezophilus C1TLV30]
MRLRATQYLFQAGWLGVLTSVTVLSVLPGSGQPVPFSFIDKIEHFSAYFTLSLFAEALPGYQRGRMMFFLVGWGGLMEVIQNYIPSRDLSLGDFICNAVGVLCGSVVGLFLSRMTMRAGRMRS